MMCIKYIGIYRQSAELTWKKQFGNTNTSDSRKRLSKEVSTTYLGTWIKYGGMDTEWHTMFG